MRAPIEYFYSTRSIYAYLGAGRIVDLAKRFQRPLLHRPIDLSKVVPAAGSQPFDRRPNRLKAYYFGREIERWSEYLGIPALVDPVHHFGDRALPSGFVIAAQRQKVDVDALHKALLQALWRDDRDTGDPAVLADLAAGLGMDPGPLLADARSDVVQAEFQRNSDDAIAKGVLGSPTYIVDGDMFYGQDRLMMVERALQTPFKAAGPAPTW
ncbi:MAG: 2-hydroxychromene-2-carboxylate isomerase [Alphaproteobacteria bacterium]|nr:2-hydroxychromene-2-carboxylate isomerase [Alphaproteobacteria bacterium]